MSSAADLAVDGGNSKTDLALVNADGSVLALVRGPLSSPHHLGVDGCLAVMEALLAEAVREARLADHAGRIAQVAALLMAGVDFPAEEEAVRIANGTEYGLTAGVYCRNEKRPKKILKRVNAGTVYWNCCDRVSPRLPWSGVKHSGIGLTLSTYGIQTFTLPKAWHQRSA